MSRQNNDDYSHFRLKKIEIMLSLYNGPSQRTIQAEEIQILTSTYTSD